MAVLQGPGDRLTGERIRIVARKITPPRLSASERSSRHKRMETIASDSVECTIEVPWKWFRDRDAARRNTPEDR
jgi:hypothetical protein